MPDQKKQMGNGMKTVTVIVLIVFIVLPVIVIGSRSVVFAESVLIASLLVGRAMGRVIRR